jgi:hypothetical protein
MSAGHESRIGSAINSLEQATASIAKVLEGLAQIQRCQAGA